MNHAMEALKNIQKLFVSSLNSLEQTLGSPIAVMGVVALVLFIAFFILLVCVFKTKPTMEEND